MTSTLILESDGVYSYSPFFSFNYFFFCFYLYRLLLAISSSVVLLV